MHRNIPHLPIRPPPRHLQHSQQLPPLQIPQTISPQRLRPHPPIHPPPRPLLDRIHPPAHRPTHRQYLHPPLLPDSHNRHNRLAMHAPQPFLLAHHAPLPPLPPRPETPRPHPPSTAKRLQRHGCKSAETREGPTHGSNAVGPISHLRNQAGPAHGACVGIPRYFGWSDHYRCQRHFRRRRGASSNSIGAPRRAGYVGEGRGPECGLSDQLFGGRGGAAERGFGDVGGGCCA